MSARREYTLVAATLLFACADPDADSDTDTGAGPDITGESTDAMTGTGAPEGEYEVPLPTPLPPGECQPGSREPCTCAGGGAGERVCLPEGRFSGCGCAGDEGVYEPPPPPVYEYCGDEPCAPYPFPASDYSGTHCCTPEGACGSTNANLFEAAKNVCLLRGAPKGTPSPACPDESIAFVDFLGCCQSNGQCGMTLDETMPNWDTGCIDRTAWKPMLDGLTTRWFAALAFFFDPNVPEWEAIACDPGG
jgi:hypothetical protein